MVGRAWVRTPTGHGGGVQSRCNVFPRDGISAQASNLGFADSQGVYGWKQGSWGKELYPHFYYPTQYLDRLQCTVACSKPVGTGAKDPVPTAHTCPAAPKDTGSKQAWVQDRSCCRGKEGLGGPHRHLQGSTSEKRPEGVGGSSRPGR